MATRQPANLLAGVRGYAARVRGCSEDLVTEVRRFEGGNRHAVYKVSFAPPGRGTEAVVVRVSHSSAPTERARAQREATVLESTGGRAAPVLYDFRLTSPWFDAPAMCMQFVSGGELDLASATGGELERLGALVAWVHARPVPDGFDDDAVRDDIAAYARRRLESIVATLAWVRDPLPASIQDDLRRIAASVQRALEARLDASSFATGEALALLHGDIGPGNVMATPDPVLIDWEYARLGDPADEIAYTFDQNGLAPAEREAFRRGYRTGVTSDTRLADMVDRVTWWEPLTLLGSMLWWVERWVRRIDADTAGATDPAASRDQDYYATHVHDRLDRLRNHVLLS